MFLLSNQTIEIRKGKDGYLLVNAASKLTGYSIQYLRRLLRRDVITGIKIGQIWLIKTESLEKYLQVVKQANDQRFGPKY